MNKIVFSRLFMQWVGYASVISLMCFLIYIVGQQGFRQEANDPQNQMAQDAANALKKGGNPKAIVGALAPVEILQSLAPYLVIYDATGNVAASSAALNGSLPKLPQGVLENVRNKGSGSVTWQPQPGVREATVSVNANGFIVVAGRSLRKTEERVSLLGQQVLFGWLMSLVAMLVVAAFQQVVMNKLDALG